MCVCAAGAVLWVDPSLFGTNPGVCGQHKQTWDLSSQESQLLDMKSFGKPIQEMLHKTKAQVLLKEAERKAWIE